MTDEVQGGARRGSGGSMAAAGSRRGSGGDGVGSGEHGEGEKGARRRRRLQVCGCSCSLARFSPRMRDAALALPTLFISADMK